MDKKDLEDFIEELEKDRKDYIQQCRNNRIKYKEEKEIIFE